MEISIIRMSSKGQIVIPSSMRKDLSRGEELLIIREGDRYILKPLDELAPALREDILFAEKTERAFAEYQKGAFREKEKSAFHDELASW